MDMKFSEKAEQLDAGIFAVLNEKKNELVKQGRTIYNLSVGTPDFPPMPHIMEAVSEAAKRPENYKYALSELPELLDAVQSFYQKRFGVQLEADEIMTMYGSQEGMAHIAWALCNPGELVLVPNPATRFHYQTALNEDTRDVDALVCQTDDYTFGLLILTPPDYYDDAAKAAADQLIASADLIYAERIDLAQTAYFDVLTPERWKYLCHYETTPTENGGYTLTYYNEDIPVLTLETRYYDGTDQPLDSVWQGYLGRITTWDGSCYDLLATISQYSEDAADGWKEMYNSYEDVINGIRIMDGCSLTEGSHA